MPLSMSATRPLGRAGDQRHSSFEVHCSLVAGSRRGEGKTVTFECDAPADARGPSNIFQRTRMPVRVGKMRRNRNLEMLLNPEERKALWPASHGLPDFPVAVD